ncbi:hypothetical protein DD509_04150 [Dehalogenimonas alkenigignens]|nr:hypothetical protein DD509_04150 [Dehalogenimonas alkenigignens]
MLNSNARRVVCIAGEAFISKTDEYRIQSCRCGGLNADNGIVWAKIYYYAKIQKQISLLKAHLKRARIRKNPARNIDDRFAQW